MQQLLQQVQQLTGKNREMRWEMNSLHILARSIHSTVSGIPHLSAPTPAPLTVAHMQHSNGWQPASLDAVLATNPLVPSNLDAAQRDLPVICHPTACTAVPAPPPPALTLASSPLSTTNTTAPLCFASHSIMVQNTLVVYSCDHLLPPPHRDYAANPELLADDWEHLEIALHPGQSEDVGVKYWKQLYKGMKHWARLRKRYSDWAVCIVPIIPFEGGVIYHDLISTSLRNSQDMQLTRVSG